MNKILNVLGMIVIVAVVAFVASFVTLNMTGNVVKSDCSTSPVIKIAEGKVDSYKNPAGNIYNTSIDFISADQVKLKINGKTTVMLGRGDTYQIDDTTAIRITSLYYSSKSDSVSSIKITYTYCKKSVSLSAPIIFSPVDCNGFKVLYGDNSYTLTATISTIDNFNRTSIINKNTGQDICVDVKEGDTCGIGDVILTINNVYNNAGTKWVKLSINQGGSFTDSCWVKPIANESTINYQGVLNILNQCNWIFGISNATQAKIVNCNQHCGAKTCISGFITHWHTSDGNHPIECNRAFDFTIADDIEYTCLCCSP